MATSTDTEPESEKNTASRAGSVIASRRRDNSTAGAWVSPPNMTWDIVAACRCAAATRRGCECPWHAAHQLLMPSMSSRPSASVSVVPAADATGSACTGLGMGP